MRRLATSTVVLTIALAGLVASLIPAAALGRGSAGGELILCNTSGVRVATGTFTFTFVTLASQGGTTTLSVAVGACTGRLFYPVGSSVTVSENVLPGYAVTGISIGPTPGGPGTTSAITSNNPAAGSAIVTIGTGQATLTFATNGPSGSASLCRVPNLFGLSFTAAKAAIRRAHCALGTVRKVYSNIYYPGVVYSLSPPRGTILGPLGRVNLTVSLGHHP
jgi:PASTA domain-containing protein